MSSTEAIQSRMASLMASLSVREPLSTGTTRVPSSRMLKHVGLLAADVLLAHVDDALQAEHGAGGGGGHAVLAGAGLGDHARFLPIRRVSRAWPSVLLILWAPVWLRSSRFR